nr:MAG TPA: hypothetical protein [Caudoviricetes sp.]
MSDKNINKAIELLNALTKVSMHSAIDVSWESSEEELMERLTSTIATKDEEHNPGPFAVMQAVGLTGTVLAMKYQIDEDKLMKILKDSKVNFVKEIKQ